ncbi:tetratricopeptide repeat protein [Streptomyces sp. NPDC006335]|uniref:tetratricopeptide repeat protein n=1 Tax=Streptomyces sp. NPDC006335 TaxID=3156895 RepID=UPI0033B5FA69
MDLQFARRHLVSLIESGADPATVLADARALLEELDQDAGLYSDIGAYASDNGESELAAEYFETALDLEPDNPLHHYDLGVALLRRGRPAEARRSLEQAIALLPYYTDALVNLAVAYLDIDEPLAAFAAANRVLDLYGDQPLPQNVEGLGATVGHWLRSPDLDEPRTLKAALEAVGEGALEEARELLAVLASGLEPGTASRAVCEEYAATVAFHLDRHSDYLAGLGQRREIVPCAQAFMPVLAIDVAEAGRMRDVDRLCHLLVAEIDPQHVPRGPVMKMQTNAARGSGSATYSVSSGDDGFYEITPVGNMADVVAPGGDRYRLYDYSGAYAAFHAP